MKNFFVFVLLLIPLVLAQNYIEDGQIAFSSPKANANPSTGNRVIADAGLNHNDQYFIAPENVFHLSLDDDNQIKCEKTTNFFSGLELEDKTLAYEAHFRWTVDPIESLDSEKFEWQARVQDITRKTTKRKFNNQGFDTDKVKFFLSIKNGQSGEMFVFDADVLYSSPHETIRGSLPDLCDQESYFPAQPAETVLVLFGANYWPNEMPQPWVQFVRRSDCSIPLKIAFTKFDNTQKLFLQGNPIWYYYCRNEENKHSAQCCRQYRREMAEYGELVDMHYAGNGKIILSTGQNPDFPPQHECDYNCVPYYWWGGDIYTGYTGEWTGEAPESSSTTYPDQDYWNKVPCEAQLDYYRHEECGHALWEYNIFTDEFKPVYHIFHDYMNYMLTPGHFDIDGWLNIPTREEHNMFNGIGFSTEIFFDEPESGTEWQKFSKCVEYPVHCAPDNVILPLTYETYDDYYKWKRDEHDFPLQNERKNFDFSPFFDPSDTNWPFFSSSFFEFSIPVTKASINFFSHQPTPFETEEYCEIWKKDEHLNSFDTQTRGPFEFAVANRPDAKIISAHTVGIAPIQWVPIWSELANQEECLDEGFCCSYEYLHWWFEGEGKRKKDTKDTKDLVTKKYDYFNPDMAICDGTAFIALTTYESPTVVDTVVKSYEDFQINLQEEPVNFIEQFSYADIDTYELCDGDINCTPYYPLAGCMGSYDTFLDYEQKKAYSLVVTLSIPPAELEHFESEQCYYGGMAQPATSFAYCGYEPLKKREEDKKEDKKEDIGCIYHHNIHVVDSDDNVHNLDISEVIDKLGGSEQETQYYIQHLSGHADCHDEVSIVIQFVNLYNPWVTRQFIVLYDKDFQNPYVQEFSVPKSNSRPKEKTIFLNNVERIGDSYVSYWQYFFYGAEKTRGVNSDNGHQQSFLVQHLIR